MYFFKVNSSHLFFYLSFVFFVILTTTWRAGVVFWFVVKTTSFLTRFPNVFKIFQFAKIQLSSFQHFDAENTLKHWRYNLNSSCKYFHAFRSLRSCFKVFILEMSFWFPPTLLYFTNYLCSNETYFQYSNISIFTVNFQNALSFEHSSQNHSTSVLPRDFSTNYILLNLIVSAENCSAFQGVPSRAKKSAQFHMQNLPN